MLIFWLCYYIEVTDATIGGSWVQETPCAIITTIIIITSGKSIIISK